jgi:hypothetical protein
MTTVARRTFASSPKRDSTETWAAIVDLVTQGRTGAARDELLAVAGIAASIIADRTPQDAPIVVTCDGPRTRLYCLYDDDAIEGSDTNEDPLGFDPLQGDWRISLPCRLDDLPWVESALQKCSTRVTVRDRGADVVKAEDAASSDRGALIFDARGFFGS